LKLECGAGHGLIAARQLKTGPKSGNPEGLYAVCYQRVELPKTWESTRHTSRMN
jgi:hypothetical protein